MGTEGNPSEGLQATIPFPKQLKNLILMNISALHFSGYTDFVPGSHDVRYYLNIVLPLKIPRALYGLSFFMPEQHREAAGSLGMQVLMRWAQSTIMEVHEAL